MDRVGEFLSLYNQLDQHMRSILGADAQRSHASLLEQMAQRDIVFQEQHSRLQAYRALRNSIIHTPFSGGSAEPIAEPREDVLANYRTVVQCILHPPPALALIATRDLYTAAWDTPIVEALAFIQQRGFDTVPILDRGVIAGMYTEQCLQRLVVAALQAGELFHLSPRAAFSELQPACGFNPADPLNASDQPALIRFMPADASVEAIEKLFRTEGRDSRFIAAVCITPTGRAFEPLLGLITAHNLPSAKDSSDYLTAVRKRFASQLEGSMVARSGDG